MQLASRSLATPVICNHYATLDAGELYSVKRANLGVYKSFQFSCL